MLGYEDFISDSVLIPWSSIFSFLPPLFFPIPPSLFLCFLFLIFLFLHTLFPLIPPPFIFIKERKKEGKKEEKKTLEWLILRHEK